MNVLVLIGFLIIGVIHGMFYAIFGDDIFEYNADEHFDQNKQPDNNWFKKRRQRIKDAPCAWKVEHFLHRFIGVFLGWLILWFLVDMRLHIFSGFKNYNPSLADLLLLILGYIGINGRLPSIPHAVDKWFGFPK